MKNENNMPKNIEYESWNAKTEEWYYPNHAEKLIFIGNTGNFIDWELVIKEVENKEGIILPNLIWPNPHFSKIRKMYENSNYNESSAEWINYYSGNYGSDYDEKLEYKFGNFVGKPKSIRAWISRINPGHTAPWHWDLDDGEAEYLAGGDIVRFSCRINPLGVGQVAVVGDNVIHGGIPGDVYQWPDHRMWHGSVNAGLTPKYQYNYLAYI